LFPAFALQDLRQAGDGYRGSIGCQIVGVIYRQLNS
jgi:hypothetical protein